jgi:hypothetical protein
MTIPEMIKTALIIASVSLLSYILLSLLIVWILIQIP